MDYNTPIDSAGFSVRTFNAIKRAFPGVNTLSELRQAMTNEEATRNLGRNSLSEINEVLAAISKTETVAPVPAGTQSTQVSDSYAEAVTCHTAILSGIQLASQGLYQMAQGFKRMRDGKLYKELGYDTFEKYCEVETGIKRRQVYNYISIAEKLPADFVHSSAQIGVKKLELLAALDDTQRAEIVENTDVERTSVKELQRKIKELTTDVEDLTIENDRLEKENQSLTFDNTNLEEERDDLIRQNNELMTRQPIVTGGIVTGGYDPEQIKEFFEDYYEAAHNAVRAVYIFVREDYPQETKDYVRGRINDLRNYIEDLEDIHEDDF